MIATGGGSSTDGPVQLWHSDGTPGPVLKGHTSRIGNNCLVWNPRGGRLASGSWDRTVRLWNRDGSAGPVLIGDAGQLQSLSWSPDGGRLASGSDSNTILVRNSRTGSPEWSAVFLGTNRKQKAVFSGGGQLLHGDPEVVEKELAYVVQHDDGRQELLQPSEFNNFADSGKPFDQWRNPPELAAQQPAWQPGPAGNALPGLIPRPAKLPGIKRWQIETALPRGDILSAMFSPDGRRLACGTATGQVRIYDAETLELVELFVDHTRLVMSVAWSPDGQWLLTAGAAWDLQLLHVREKRKIAIGLDSSTLSVSWAPDSSRFAVAHAPGVSVWTVDGERTMSLAQPGNEAVAWSPDGQWIAFSGAANKVRLWQVADGAVGPVVETSHGRTKSIAWSPDSQRFATGGGSTKIQVWNRDGTLDRTLEAPPDSVLSLAWSPQADKLVSSGTDIKVHDLEDDSKSVLMPRLGGGVKFDVCWHPDGERFASVDQSQFIELWRASGVLLKSVAGHGIDNDMRLSWSHDGRFLATTHRPAGIRLWNVHGLSQIVLKGSGPMAWRPGTSEIVTQTPGGGAFQLWDTHGKLLSMPISPHTRCRSVAWSPDGERLAVGLSDGATEIWQSGGDRLATLKGQKGRQVWAIGWSPDGNALVTKTTANATLWKPDGTPDVVLPATGTSIAWNPTGDRFALSGRTTSIWNLDGTRGPEIPGGNRGVDNCVDWSPDGKRLATGSYDQTVRLWSNQGRPQAVLRAHNASVTAVGWDASSTLVASAASDASVIVWDAQEAEPRWIGVQLSDGNTVTFSAAGQVLDGDSGVLEKHFVYLIETEDGGQELLKPSEFQKLINQPLRYKPASPQPGESPKSADRRAAEWLQSIDGGGRLDIGGRTMDFSANTPLPDEPFRLTMLHAAGKVDASPQALDPLIGLIGLTSVNLYYHRWLEDDDVAFLANNPDLYQVVLADTAITDKTLARLRSCRSLRDLNLGGTQVTNDGLMHLRALPALESVNLSHTRVDDDGLELLKFVETLTQIQVGGPNFTGAGLVHLKSLPRWTSLIVDNMRLSSTAFQHLVELGDFTRLDLIKIDGLSDEDMRALKPLTQLEVLILQLPELSDAGLKHVAALKQLRELHLIATQATQAGVAELQDALPNCKVNWDGGSVKPETKADETESRTAGEKKE